MTAPANRRVTSIFPDKAVQLAFDPICNAFRVVPVDLIADFNTGVALIREHYDAGTPLVDEAIPTDVADAKFWDLYGRNNILLNIFITGGTNPTCSVLAVHKNVRDRITFGQKFEGVRTQDDLVFTDLFGRYTAFIVLDITGSPTKIEIEASGV
jgi:hypothetical protein